jgi:hypothetical protein
LHEVDSSKNPFLSTDDGLQVEFRIQFLGNRFVDGLNELQQSVQVASFFPPQVSGDADLHDLPSGIEALFVKAIQKSTKLPYSGVIRRQLRPSIDYSQLPFRGHLGRGLGQTQENDHRKRKSCCAQNQDFHVACP